jgi:hypothetical protein
MILAALLPAAAPATVAVHDHCDPRERSTTTSAWSPSEATATTRPPSTSASGMAERPTTG